MAADQDLSRMLQKISTDGVKIIPATANPGKTHELRCIIGRECLFPAHTPAAAEICAWQTSDHTQIFANCSFITLFVLTSGPLGLYGFALTTLLLQVRSSQSFGLDD